MNSRSDKGAGPSSIPAVALWLGVSGLIPFIAMAVLAIDGRLPLPFDPGRALLGYGAVILSFLGGIHWGIALGQPVVRNNIPDGFTRSLILGVVPSIIGWFALLLPMKIGIAVLCAGFAMQLRVDLSSVARGALPDWFARLRIVLTGIVLISLVAAGFLA